MNPKESYFRLQYDLVKKSREILLAFCTQITERDFLSENNSFGRGSMRNLLIHIANAYEFWIIQHALKRDVVFTEYSSKNTKDEIRTVFSTIDIAVFDFITLFESSALTPIDLKINGIKKQTNALELFTHVITHEFHHKGQILFLSRHLGYMPVDTDIIR